MKHVDVGVEDLQGTLGGVQEPMLDSNESPRFRESDSFSTPKEFHSLENKLHSDKDDLRSGTQNE